MHIDGVGTLLPEVQQLPVPPGRLVAGVDRFSLPPQPHPHTYGVYILLPMFGNEYAELPIHEA